MSTEKPRITALRSVYFSIPFVSYRCSGMGLIGFGLTPAAAYAEWDAARRKWWRRMFRSLRGSR